MQGLKRRLKATLAVALVLAPLGLATPAAASTNVAEMIRPHEASYGFYVDTYLNNTADHKTIYNNPAVGVTSEFYRYWSPDKGILNQAVLDMSVAATAKATQNRTAAEERRSFFTDRVNLPYTIVSGLGPYATAFVKNAEAQTSYHVMPTKPVAKNDKAPKVPWANPNSKLGAIVQLINLNRLPYGKSSFPKKVYRYERPYRQSHNQVRPDPYLADFMAAAPKTDYDFPSGHSSAAFESGPTLAYVFPERFQQLVTRSSEICYDRMLVGRHSALAVMGGRAMGQAVTAGILNDPQNAALIKRAYREAHSVALQKSPLVTTQDEFANYRTNQQNYRFRLTYGLPQIGNTHVGPRVPKGAEVLLKTRLPYLTANQRRLVLATTELASGYPVLDDTEGWGRLDLFSAANGYGSLPATTKITMNAARGGFNAQDTWKNNITGTGRLVKQGTGSLALAGNNQFSGGIQLRAGGLTLTNAHAAGTGTLDVQAGTVTTGANLRVGHDYRQATTGKLVLAGPTSGLKVHGRADLAGTLVLKAGSRLRSGQTIMTFKHRSGRFAHVQGLPQGWHLKYTDQKIQCVRN
ncbi:phosphatase PAP2 family protein [Levilactobacillus spicheri]|uniref:Phosphatidic acid phosphatase type 2/haloperoxidase domain-containing protein n=1 Tax=Levilactobacillus spicheri TaxID=216463 RepID=A0A0F3RUJ4_9LACO|nr:phosphatase PAP2 family protein [Levilactobacillus spicheri]KJW12437.1 hypothetical protein VC81_08005 [Levilactobacillus spicheri]